ncbi:MAG: 30S ribosomal protein S6 [Bacteroidetes bacterium]|nr:30S ribosomal protein S6 [Bacteroidota bacterium]MCH8170964.1 30S ribosomal protein S6 [Bacteroidota bacterium]MCH8941053.1 30S ribosomal protein S6 [Bacteroidota bacterium]
MSKNVYESAVIINAALDDEQIQSQVSRIKDAITSNNGVINEIEDWGRKRLAYPINKSKIGYYIFYRYEAQNTTAAKLERMFNLDEQILRYLTLKLDNNALEYLEQKKSEAANKVEENKKPDLPTEKQVDLSDDDKGQDI